MTTSKNATHMQGTEVETVGLLANGSAGQWDVAIDEAISGRKRWFAQIEGAAISLYFEISSPSIVADLQHFLECTPAVKRASPNGSKGCEGLLVIGKDNKTPVTVLKDDEYQDRFFIVVGRKKNPIVRYAISGVDAAKLAEALRQVQEDLDDEE